MLKDWNFWVAVITAFVALFALFQTKQQIKLSNKQHLFDERIEQYLIALGLIELYLKEKSLLKKENTSAMAVDFLFERMTNNIYLEDITLVIQTPLEQPLHKIFLTKLESMKNVAAKIKLIFNEKPASLLGQFILRYQELLFSMYQYKILLTRMQKSSQQFNWSLEEAQKKMNEGEQRDKLYLAFDNLENAYILLDKEKVKEKIEKQIKLK